MILAISTPVGLVLAVVGLACALYGGSKLRGSQLSQADRARYRYSTVAGATWALIIVARLLAK